jgi:hypothetical protein
MSISLIHISCNRVFRIRNKLSRKKQPLVIRSLPVATGRAHEATDVRSSFVRRPAYRPIRGTCLVTSIPIPFRDR